MISKECLLETFFQSIVDKEHLGRRDLSERMIRKLSKPQRVRLIDWCNTLLRTDQSIGYEAAIEQVLELAEYYRKK